MSDRHPINQAPVNPLPPAVVALFLVLLAIEGAFSLGESGLIGGPEAVGWRNEMVQRFGFSNRVFEWMIANGSFPVEHLVRFVSYPFLHGDFYHALFAMVILLAMGKVVGEGIGTGAFVTIFFVSGIVGAAAFGFLSDDPWLVGAYPSVYGLIGGFTYLLWMRLGRFGAPQYAAFTLIGFLMGIQLLFSLLFGGNAMWIADIVGFFVGFLLSLMLVPGGMARIRALLRRD